MNILSGALATLSLIVAPVHADTDVVVKDVAQEQILQSTEEKAVQKTVEDIAREKILTRWKDKQFDKWQRLPQEAFTINASAYTAAADECGKSDGVTASGVTVQEERTLACPPEYPFGAQIAIDGMGVYTCEDRGGAIKGNHFDIYVETKSEAFAFGRQNLTARVIF